MRIRCRILALSVVMLAALSSCDAIFPDRTAPTATEVFDEIWNDVNQRYVCFANKEVDWDSVYSQYRRQINDDTNESQLFSVLCRMLGELKDGHVSLKTDTDGWSGYQKESDVSVLPSIVSLYLGEDCKSSGGLRYNTLRQGAVGYIEYASFGKDITEEQVEEALAFCKDCHGLILDLRANPGGALTNMVTLLKYLPCQTELFQSLVRHNSERTDFIYKGTTFRPGVKDESTIWRKSLIVLIDNGSFSASSTFAMCVKGCSGVTLIGVKTAGGTNAPQFFELSNGWMVRIPVIKYRSRTGVDYEDGVPPDIEVPLDRERIRHKVDNIIEVACDMIMDH